MNRARAWRVAVFPLAVVLGLGLLWVAVPKVHGADHGDAPLASNYAAGDINDVFAFLDPNDNTRVVLILTLRGFIAAGENANFGQFDPRILSAFEIDTSGDAAADLGIAVTFSPQTSRAAPQTATVVGFNLPSFSTRFTFTAPTTISNTAATAPAQTITNNAGGTGINFFAGMTDDPFFFDIPGFGRFVNAVLTNQPNPASNLTRGRDSFAGYNTMAIALSIPRTMLTTGDSLGVGVRTFRISGTLGTPSFTLIEQLDRTGVPAVNVALTPFAVKDAFNLADPVRDAAGEFAGGIVQTLTSLGTSQANIQTLADIAVNNGDLLRLDLQTANSGPGGGNNAGAGFPNGRRLGDDTVDTLLFFITNGAVTPCVAGPTPTSPPATPGGDNACSNELALRDTFPFLALPNQPFAPGTTDDFTRN
jgi:Domain of unknown function (DUF4331)